MPAPLFFTCFPENGDFEISGLEGSVHNLKSFYSILGLFVINDNSFKIAYTQNINLLQ